MYRLLLLAPLTFSPACTDDKGGDDSEPTETLTDADNDGYYAEEDDCDDGDVYVYPGASESCDGVDNNCDGATDEGVMDTYYTDGDGDGFGDDASPLSACEKPDGATTVGTDCDDADATIHPAASEVCDTVDNDCDGLTDDQDDLFDQRTGTVFYADLDGDGYGDPDNSALRCAAGDGYGEDATDCDDADPEIQPMGTETCDGVDNDCDGAIDDDDTDVEGGITAYTDADLDTYGDPDAPVQVCGYSDDAVADASDCDDADAAVNPAAAESCRDEIDNNCDGAISDACEGCDELAIISYYDSFTAGASPLEESAALYGLSVSASSSSATFASTYDAGTWDVLVIDVPGSSLPTDVTSRLSTAISDGTVVLFAYWYLGYESTTAALLGVTVDSSYSTPLPLSAATGSTLWEASEVLPASISGYTYDAGVNGQVLSPVDASTSETLAIYSGDATQEAILATFDGQVVVNGFLPWDYQDTDDDGDGQMDMAELYINELAWATGCTP